MLSQSDRFELIAMHEYRRPHGAPAEEKFIKRFIVPLGVRKDSFGNRYKIIGDNPTILWSCHTDTVHHVGGRQRLSHWGGVLRLAYGERSNCLGADDTAGVWMLMQMIRKRVPGLYVFHRGEERGCLGSHHFGTHHQKLLAGIDIAIAFDRRGKKDIVDHQLGQRCCSKTFVESLGAGLKMGYSGAHGSYTDTATYMRMIPECSNLSVGYEGAHWKTETLDMVHLAKLRDAMLSLKTKELAVERDPTFEEEPWWKQQQHNKSWEEQPFSGGHHANNHNQRKDELAESYNGFVYDQEVGDWVRETRCVTIADFLRAYPDVVADYLEDMGFNAADIKDHIDKVDGGMRLDELFKSNGAAAK